MKCIVFIKIREIQLRGTSHFRVSNKVGMYSSSVGRKILSYLHLPPNLLHPHKYIFKKCSTDFEFLLLGKNRDVRGPYRVIRGIGTLKNRDKQKRAVQNRVMQGLPVIFIMVDVFAQSEN